MSTKPDVFRHLPFERGCASIVAACVPQGRVGLERYEARQRICHVVLFRDGQLAEQACFFGTSAVLDWIASELGALRLDRMRPGAGVDARQFVAHIRCALAAHGLLPVSP